MLLRRATGVAPDHQLLGITLDDWEELAPAVLGVSAAELEEGWHAAMREGAPLGVIH
jgi:hypothetical protein